MSAGPLRRMFAILGMVTLVPILAMMASGAITPVDAAVRAVSVAMAVVVLGNMARIVLTGALRRVERRTAPAEVQEQVPA